MTNAERHLRSADLFNRRDWDGFMADFATDCEYVDQARGITVKGREQYLQYEQAWITAFSDGMMTDAQVIDGGSHTVLRFTGSGTNDGPLGPLPATGRTASVRLCEIREYDSDGKVRRGELFYDQVTMMIQLGHMQPPEG
jgi:steroid delta-isomerase-like uncharacterized protein